MILPALMKRKAIEAIGLDTGAGGAPPASISTASSTRRVSSTTAAAAGAAQASQLSWSAIWEVYEAKVTALITGDKAVKNMESGSESELSPDEAAQKISGGK